MGYSSIVKEFHRYGPGVPQADEWGRVFKRYMEGLQSLERDPFKHSTGPSRHLVDLVWVVEMCRAQIISRETAARLLSAIKSIQSGKAKVSHTESHGYAERQLIEALDGDEDLASTVNLGRTLQEPMFRLDLRDLLLDTLGEILETIDAVNELADRHADVIMPGHTHMSQAQPITLGAYLVTVVDGLDRSYRQLELGYEFTNLNTGGCGATSGITWPIDREHMAELLGFDGVVEPAYDAEASQDHSLAILGGLSTMMVLLSRTSMDFGIWSMEEMDMLRVDPAWCGVSSMMPQKCIPGSLLERVRLEAGYVISQAAQAATTIKGEPHGDMLPALEPPKIALLAMIRCMAALGFYRGVVSNAEPVPEKMLEYVQKGFSCSSEVAAHLVKDLEYGPRRAHRVVATMVRMARERGLVAGDATGELLDEAARFAEEREPGLSTEKLQSLLDPKEFVKTHNNQGGVAPPVVRQMVSTRKVRSEKARKRQDERRERVRLGLERLDAEVDKILQN